jgi:hypothetical protein
LKFVQCWWLSAVYKAATPWRPLTGPIQTHFRKRNFTFLLKRGWGLGPEAKKKKKKLLELPTQTASQLPL